MYQALEFFYYLFVSMSVQVWITFCFTSKKKKSYKQCSEAGLDFPDDFMKYAPVLQNIQEQNILWMHSYAHWSG